MGEPVLRFKRPRWVPPPVETPGSSQPAKKKVKLTDPAVGGKNIYILYPISYINDYKITIL